MIGFDLALDLFPLLTGVLAAVCCALLGNFLVLRRLSLMGDAISHSVLPGLVIAFLITATRSPTAMLLGAAAAGLLTVLLVELVQRLGRVEPGAAMGVVFSILFAVGVLLIRQVSALDTVDLDADCVLHGQLETLVWFEAPSRLVDALRWSTLEQIPRTTLMLAGMTVAVFSFVGLLFKEIRIASFDPALATTQGFHAGLLHVLLMVFVAAATVASFEAVGSILVIAMLVVPAAAARLLTDRLLAQLATSLLVALLSSVGGYFAATLIPAQFGLDPLSAAGSMTVVGGVLLLGAIIASPRHGLIAKAWRRRSLAISIARDDLLAALYRASESGIDAIELSRLRTLLPGRTLSPGVAAAAHADLICHQHGSVSLTDVGRERAAALVRRHRLWEHYLVQQVGLAPDHVHQTAERLEHLPVSPAQGPAEDPHGRPIP